MSLFESKAIGRLTADPELKYVQYNSEDVAVCTFSLAVNYGFGDNEKTEFVDCVAWRKIGEAMAKHLVKGRKIYVSGHQQTRKYERDVNGESVTMRRTEWVIDDFDFCDSQYGGNKSSGSSAAPSAPVKDDDVPF